MTRTTPKPKPAGPVPALVLCTEPETVTDRTGTPVPAWFVSLADKDREPAGRVYKVFDWGRARFLAACMADDRNLPLVDEAGFA